MLSIINCNKNSKIKSITWIHHAYIFSKATIAKLLILLISLCFFTSVHAAVQRSFINGDLEVPKARNAIGCWDLVDADNVPGWETTHKLMPTAVTNTCNYAGITASTGAIMEFWANSFTGVQPRSGTQIAELNASESSTIYQKICINKNEDIAWSLSHRARSASAANRMMFVIGPSVASIAVSNLSTLSSTGNIATLESFSNGTGSVLSCQAGSNLSSNSACTKSTTTTGNGTKWMDYAGNFKWTGASAEMYLAFGSVLSDPEGAGSGNLIDNVKVTLKPYVEFSSSTISLANTSVITAPSFGLKVVGDISTPLTVKVSVTGGTAILGTDFTTPGGLATFNVIVPAGVYNGSTVIPVGINVLDDPASSPNATINLKIDTDTNYVVASSQTCGGAAVSTSSVTILDAVNVSKSALPVTGSKVKTGDVLTFTLTAKTDGGPLKSSVILTDTLSSGLTLVSSSIPSQCIQTLQVITCTLPIGTPIGTYSFVYQAVVNSSAQSGSAPSVKNTVVTNAGNCVSCETIHPFVDVFTSKKALPTSSESVTAGQFINYTLETKIVGAALTQELVLTDTLSVGLVLKTPLPTQCSAIGNVLTCKLPVGTAPGTYSFTYKALVSIDAIATAGGISNSVVSNLGLCNSCKVVHQVTSVYAVNVATTKLADPANGSNVELNSEINYKLRAKVEGGPLGENLVLTDTLGDGLTLIGTLPTECNVVARVITCILEAGSPIGVYEFSYKTIVNENSVSGGVSNSVASSVGTCLNCKTNHYTTKIDTLKTVESVSRKGENAVFVGDVLKFTIKVQVTGGKVNEDLILNDTLSSGLLLTKIPNNCVGKNQKLVCTLPKGSAAGVYKFEYQAVVTEDAADSVSNEVVPSNGTCKLSCKTSTKVIHKVDLRLTKTASKKQIKIGEFIRYQVLIENLQEVDANDFFILDQAAPGLSYVEGSLRVTGDKKWKQTQTWPLKIENLDVSAKSKITVEYLMKVNSGAGRGQLCNNALASDADGIISSNSSKACVQRTSDPDFEDALIFGVVFDDKNKNGIQDADELGIAGARLSTATGLVIETDFAGRYHITGIDPGQLSRGKNFILKLEASSLLENYEMTTQNPLVKRVTWGLPVQFNFGLRRSNSMK